MVNTSKPKVLQMIMAPRIFRAEDSTLKIWFTKPIIYQLATIKRVY